MTVLTTHNRRAAHGKHVCELCGRRIAQSELYEDQRCADSGTVYTVRRHLPCISAHSSWDPDEDFLPLSELSNGHLPPCSLAWSTAKSSAVCTCDLQKP